MATDKLSIINECLLLAGGNDPVNTPDDGSPEWTVASAAYDRAVEHLLDEHDWKFGRAHAVLNRVGDSSDERFVDAYAKPAGALHVSSVTVGGVAADYRVVGTQIWLNAGSGTVHAFYVQEPGPQDWPGLFIKALSCFVMAGIWGGLNEEPGEARRQREEGEEYLKRARSRSDQEQPRRTLLISNVRRARRTRRG